MKARLVAAALLVPALALAQEAAPPAAAPVAAAPPAASPPAAAPPAAAPPAKPPEWKGTVGAGLVTLSGNSESTTFTGTAVASRETLGWVASVKAAAAYGEGRPAGAAASQVLAYSGALQLRLDRKLGDVWSVFVLGGVEADHVASIEYRTATEVGAGAQLVERKEDDWLKVGLRTDLGLRYGYEARYQYYGTPLGPQPGVELVAPRVGVAFRYGFSKEVFLTEEAEAMTSLSGESRWLAKSVTKLSSRLSRSLTFGAGYSVAYDSRPAAGKVTTDQALTALLEVGF
jgi:opacity protein-like surface antigen